MDLIHLIIFFSTFVHVSMHFNGHWVRDGEKNELRHKEVESGTALRCPEISPKVSRKQGWVKTADVHPLENMLSSKLPSFSVVKRRFKVYLWKNQWTLLCNSTARSRLPVSWHKKQSTSPRLRNWNPTVTGWDPWIACSALNRCAVVSSAFTKLLEPQRSSLNLMKQFHTISTIARG